MLWTRLRSFFEELVRNARFGLMAKMLVALQFQVILPKGLAAALKGSHEDFMKPDYKCKQGLNKTMVWRSWGS